MALSSWTDIGGPNDPVQRSPDGGQPSWETLTGDAERVERCDHGKDRDKCELCSHTAMAMTPEQVQQYNEQYGPYLYHGSPELNEWDDEHYRRPMEDRTQDILTNGLFPNEMGMYHHKPSVYLSNDPAMAHGFARSGQGGPGAIFRVDINKLDPSLLEADEWQTPPDSPGIEDYHGDSEWSKTPAHGQFLADPKNTWDSLSGNWNQLHPGTGAVAYRGHIPADAIELHDTVEERWPKRDLDEPKYEPQHYSASEDELHIALALPQHIADEIEDWVSAQDWPEGTELEDKDDYHITLLYAKDGHEDHNEADWLRHSEGYDVKVTGVDEFGDEDPKAIVLRLDSPEVLEHANDLQDMAERRDLDISRFPGGYKPHITVAYGPHKPAYIRAPKLKFRSGPSEVSEPRVSSWREAMADRTGQIDIDDLIDQFKHMPVPREIHDVTGPGATVGDMHDPRMAWGNCNNLATYFAEFCQEHGYQASCSQGDEFQHGEPDDLDWMHPAELGYEKYDPQTHLDGHAVTFVHSHDGSVYTVDWTAAQYGYTDEFPLVQRLDQSGQQHLWNELGQQWQRSFSHTAGLWDEMMSPGVECPRCHSNKTVIDSNDPRFMRCNTCRHRSQLPNLVDMAAPLSQGRDPDYFFQSSKPSKNYAKIIEAKLAT